MRANPALDEADDARSREIKKGSDVELESDGTKAELPPGSRHEAFARKELKEHLTAAAASLAECAPKKAPQVPDYILV